MDALLKLQEQTNEKQEETILRRIKEDTYNYNQTFLMDNEIASLE